MRRSIFLLICVLAGAAMITGASGDEGGAHRTGDFQGKVIWASIKGSVHVGMTLAEVETKYLGKNGYLVGKICPMDESQSPWEGLITWVRMDEIDVLWEFPSVAKARSVFAEATKRRQAQQTFPPAGWRPQQQLFPPAEPPPPPLSSYPTK
jgi:hypothetical protein